MRRLKGICRFCKNKSENIYGEYCTKADFHDDEYGSFWRRSKCIHDQHHDLKNLFDPIEEPEIYKKIDILKARLVESEKENCQLRDENTNLRSLINPRSK